jgi:hypothetical protein
VTGENQVKIEDAHYRVDEISPKLLDLSTACGGSLIVVVGSEDQAYRETVVALFAVLKADPSVEGVGIATEKFLAKQAGKPI